MTVTLHVWDMDAVRLAAKDAVVLKYDQQVLSMTYNEWYRAVENMTDHLLQLPQRDFEDILDLYGGYR